MNYSQIYVIVETREKKLFSHQFHFPFELMYINSIWREKNNRSNYHDNRPFYTGHYILNIHDRIFNCILGVQSAFLCPKICHTFHIDLRLVDRGRCLLNTPTFARLFLYGVNLVFFESIVFENGKTFTKVKLIVQSLYCDATFSIHFFFF